MFFFERNKAKGLKEAYEYAEADRMGYYEHADKPVFKDFQTFMSRYWYWFPGAAREAAGWSREPSAEAAK